MDFERAKKAYDSMSWQEQQKFAEQNKNNPEFQQFANQYLGGNKQIPPQTQPNPAPVENNVQNQTSPNGQNWENGGWNQQTSPQPAQTQTQPQTQPQGHQFGYQTDETYRKQRDSQYAEQLFMSNPNAFDYNSVYNYIHQQAPDVSPGEVRNTVENIQRQYHQLSRVSAMNGLSAEKIREGLLNGIYSQNDLEQLRQRNPEKYNEYLAYHNKRNTVEDAAHNAKVLYNLWTGNSVKEERSTEEILLKMVEQFFGKINYDESIVDRYKEALNSPGIQKQKDKMLDAQREMDDIDDELDSLRDDIKRQYPWIPKSQLNAIVQDRSVKLLKRKNELHKDYQRAKGDVQFEMNLAGMKFEADLKGIQIEREEFSDKMQALGFAKGIFGFETPQQQRDAELEHIKKKSELEAELSDINSKDPKIQFNAVMKALDPHYKEFGSIILRPQAQAAQDIINLAKKEGISVGEAMRKNFTEPLQKKDGYKMTMNKNYGISNEPKEPKIVNIWWTDYQYDPSTWEYRLPQLSNGTSFTDYQMKGRANRHNNPTAMTTDVAKSLGMVEGVDYVKGDSFGNGRYYTAKLLGNGVETTINAFDKTANDPKKKIFYTQSGKQRWTYLAMSDEEWLSLSQEEKIWIIQRMYNNEEQRDRRNFGAFGYSGGKLSQGSFVQSREPLYMNYLSSGKLPDNAKLKSMWLSADMFSQEAIAYGESIWWIETKEQKKEITDLRKEFNNSPEAKAFAVVKPMYETVKNTAELKTAAGDLSLIFAYMKILDPNSTVREGEFANAQNAGGVDDKIRNLYNKVMKGTRLSDRQRKDFVNNAGVLYNSYAKEYNTKLEQWKSYSIEWWDTNRIWTSANIFWVGGNTLYADIATSLLNESGTGAGSVASFDSNNPLSYIAWN